MLIIQGVQVRLINFLKCWDVFLPDTKIFFILTHSILQGHFDHQINYLIELNNIYDILDHD